MFRAPRFALWACQARQPHPSPVPSLSFTTIPGEKDTPNNKEEDKKETSFSGGSKFFVLKGGKLVEGTGTPRNKAENANLGVTRDDLKRHQQLVRRQHFME
mmetsp:Transcript_29806/g.46123  ORF Transcript_29806/g.46123 Transcript_29806/m.46123 type:complete len:101 (-) Transcript_29806:181-483(-)